MYRYGEKVKTTKKRIGRAKTHRVTLSQYQTNGRMVGQCRYQTIVPPERQQTLPPTQKQRHSEYLHRQKVLLSEKLL